MARPRKAATPRKPVTAREDGVSGQTGGTGIGVHVAERTDGRAATYTPKTPEERVEVATSQADALFAQLEALVAPEPGMHKGQMVNKNAAKEIGLDDPTGALAVPMIAAQVESAGYTWVYDQIDGDRSKVNNNMLNQALRKLHPETGKVMFSTRPPLKDGKPVVPFAGSVKCRLHPEDPERALWDQMGFQVCETANLRKEYDRTRHMETRHKQEWKAIKEREADIEKQEQKAERKALLQLVSKGAA